MKIARYGAAFLHFNGADAALVLEVQRKQRQRPIMAVASFGTTGVMAPNSYNRLLVYRGSPFNERVAGASPDPTIPSANGPASWDTVPLLRDNFAGVEVIYDAIVTGGQQPVTIDFRDWPDELCIAQEGQALGAMVLQPIDGTTGGFLANANAILTFIGGDAPGEPDADVRSLKAK